MLPMPRIETSEVLGRDLVRVTVEGSVTDVSNTYIHISKGERYGRGDFVNMHLNKQALDDLIILLTYQRDHGEPHSMWSKDKKKDGLVDWERELLYGPEEDDFNGGL